MMQQINYLKPAVGNLGRESHPWRRCLGCLAFGLLILSGQSTQVFGQLAEPDTVPVENGKQLDASKLVGSEQITEGRVTATISFLASDELGGRETNSKEFEIATAYVASRFRGAGLEGGGKDGSYFHETLVPQYRVPESVVFTGPSRAEPRSEPNSSSNPTQNATGKPTEKSDRAPIAHYGLLNAGEQEVEIEGVATDVSLDAFQAPEAKIPPLAGIIRGRFETTAKGSRALSQLTRLATRLKEAGAAALLLECDPESEWYKQAELARMKPRIEKMGRRFADFADLECDVNLRDSSIKSSRDAARREKDEKCCWFASRNRSRAQSTSRFIQCPLGPFRIESQLAWRRHFQWG